MLGNCKEHHTEVFVPMSLTFYQPSVNIVSYIRIKCSSPDNPHDDGTKLGAYTRVGCLENVDSVVHDHGKPTELATHEHQEHEQDGFPVACVPADRTLIFK